MEKISTTERKKALSREGFDTVLIHHSHAHDGLARGAAVGGNKAGEVKRQPGVAEQLKSQKLAKHFRGELLDAKGIHRRLGDGVHGHENTQ